MNNLAQEKKYKKIITALSVIIPIAKIKLNNPSMIIKSNPINKICKNKVNLNPFDNFHI